jgi:uncharacterized protein YbaR (Trm112 family)
MKRNFLSLLGCPKCHSQLISKQESSTLQLLNCESCQTSVPVINGFVLFSESFQLDRNISQSGIDRLTNYFKSDCLVYQDYIDRKYTRDIQEIYAAVQPFNEATRAIYPFLSKLKDTIKANDVIIDTWSRSGWHGLLLSGLFPEQQIISVWDGNNGVLGYAGYGYWFSEDKRPENLEIVFSAPEDPLPFRDNVASVIIAHDVLHRRELDLYGDELLRISDRDAVILAPHIHLSNNQPDPYFERGGILRHGELYSQYYHQQIDGTNLDCLILAERDLFNYRVARSLEDRSTGVDYNALLAIADSSWLNQYFINDIENIIHENARFIHNPLLQVNPISGCIELKPKGLSGKTQYYLDRHPCYAARIKPIIGHKLERDSLKLLVANHHNRHGTIEDYARVLGWSIIYTKSIASTLQQYELISALPTTTLAIDLQYFHTNQHSLLPHKFKDFWQRSLESSPDRHILTLEGEPLTISEVQHLMSAICTYYIENGINLISIVEIDIELDWSQQLILMMSVWWLSDSIKTIIKNYSIKPIIADDIFVVTKPFWEIIELYLDMPIKSVKFDRSSCQEMECPMWYEISLSLI